MAKLLFQFFLNLHLIIGIESKNIVFTRSVLKELDLKIFITIFFLIPL